MAEEIVDVVIHPDGRVEIKVQGVKGKTCTEITAEVEAALGGAAERTLTTEYHQKADEKQKNKQRLDG